MRLFVAVNPSPAVGLRLMETINRLRPCAPSARWVDPDTLHVTLAFLGEVEVARVSRISEALENVAANQTPFEIRTVGLGTFGPPLRPRVLWAAIAHREGDALSRLHAATVAALEPLGFAPEARPLTPHITLARAGGSAAIRPSPCAPPARPRTTARPRAHRCWSTTASLAAPTASSPSCLTETGTASRSADPASQVRVAAGRRAGTGGRDRPLRLDAVAGQFPENTSFTVERDRATGCRQMPQIMA